MTAQPCPHGRGGTPCSQCADSPVTVVHVEPGGGVRAVSSAWMNSSRRGAALRWKGRTRSGVAR